MQSTIETVKHPVFPLTTENSDSPTVNLARINNISNSTLSPEALQFIHEKLIKNKKQVTMKETVRFLHDWDEQVSIRRIKMIGLATYCKLNYRSLLARWYEFRKLQQELQQTLSVQARQWLDQLQLNEPENGTTVARLYLKNSLSITELKINVTQFAQRYNIKPITLQRALTECKAARGSEAIATKQPARNDKIAIPKTINSKPSRVLLLSSEALRFLKENLIKDQYQVAINDVIHFIHSYPKEIKYYKINKKDMARCCNINYQTLLANLNHHRCTQRESQQVLSASAQQWLNQLQLTENNTASNVEKLYRENLAKIKHLNINATQFAIRFGVKPISFKQILEAYKNGRKKPAAKNASLPTQKQRPLRPLTAEEMEWFRPLQGKSKVSGREVAKCLMPHLSKIKYKSVLRRIANHFNIPFLGFRNTIVLLRKNKRELEQGLTAEAIAWLNQLPLKKNPSPAAVAKCYLAHLPQMNQWGVNRSLLALHYGLLFFSMNQAIEKQIASAKRKKNISIKQEPVGDENEVEPWYPALTFRKMPTLLYPEDMEIALGHAQGPIREKLAEVDLATLRITQCPEFPQLLTNRKMRIAATERLRNMIEAASKGQLQQLIKDESYYKLIIDEQHPELGMGLYATKPIPQGHMLGIYPGVVYSSYQEFLQAANTVDSNFSAFAFQCNCRRPRRKIGGVRKRPLRAEIVIGGHLQNGLLVFANTGAVAEDGSVMVSENNNLAAAIAAKEIIVFVATRDIAAGEKLLINYGKEYLIRPHQPIKQEPQEQLCME